MADSPTSATTRRTCPDCREVVAWCGAPGQFVTRAEAERGVAFHDCHPPPMPAPPTILVSPQMKERYNEMLVRYGYDPL